jgi:hypothetical protein
MQRFVDGWHGILQCGLREQKCRVVADQRAAPLDVCAEPTYATAVPLIATADAITFQSNRRSFVKQAEKIFGLKLAYSQRSRSRRPCRRRSHQPGAIQLVQARITGAAIHQIRSIRSIDAITFWPLRLARFGALSGANAALFPIVIDLLRKR